MIPINFPKSNINFTPPTGEEGNCEAMRGQRGHITGGAYDGHPVVVVAWQPSPEDVVAIQKGAPIFVTLFQPTLPVHVVSTDYLEELKIT